MLNFLTDNKEHLRPWEDESPEACYTLKYQRKTVRFEKREFKSGRAVDLWILAKHEHRLIGKVTVFGILRGNCASCMIGYKLDKEYEGKGYMSEAVGEVVRFLFEDVNMHRVEINILPRNERSIHVAERLGFTAEALSPAFMRVNGVWEDHIRYVKFNDNYIAR
jgi:ribosomal-protein-alanine N-acetyltransferase